MDHCASWALTGIVGGSSMYRNVFTMLPVDTMLYSVAAMALGDVFFDTAKIKALYSERKSMHYRLNYYNSVSSAQRQLDQVFDALITKRYACY